MLITGSLICQLISWSTVTTDCSWQQWAPTLAGCAVSLVCRVSGMGRLATFVDGITAFAILTGITVAVSPVQSANAPAGWMYFAGLFLIPVALVASLTGLICGDVLRILKKRRRENGV